MATDVNARLARRGEMSAAKPGSKHVAAKATRVAHPRARTAATNGTTAAATNGTTAAATNGTTAAATNGTTAASTNGTNAASTNGTNAASTNGTNAAATRADEALEGLLDEAQAAVSASANTLRDVRERYRTLHQEELERWHALRAQLAPGLRGRSATAREEAVAAGDVGAQQAELARLELAIKSLENAWLLLEPDDETLVGDPSGAASSVDVQMRIIEAQEAERNRLAREVHDGPAQALANGIFQIEIIERLLDRDERLARQELRNLRDMLTRELRGVRAYLSQLRPPLLADLGLAGAIREAAEQIGSVVGVPVDVVIDAEIDALPEAIEVVILRVVQEALQNVRKHAQPRNVRVRAARDATGEHGGWLVEVRDDGVGFDADAAGNGPRGAGVASASAGRRSFGLQFMRERAELIGGRFEVRSGKDLGTVIRLVVPGQEEETR
jgi:signal transduction histidine kinase